MLKVGDWVTQYSAGYWKVLHIIPKYAEEDYSYEGKSWKKGDLIGNWVILKKGFTPKMKPSNLCEAVDLQWCRPVSNEILQSIEKAFAENPKAKEKFDKATNLPKPAIASVWMNLSDEHVESFSEVLGKLPERFTEQQLRMAADEYLAFEADPSIATYILYLFSHPWERSETIEPLYCGSELKKYK